VGEMAAALAVLNRVGKAAYLVPYRALAAQKASEFTKAYGPYSAKIVLAMGDNDVQGSAESLTKLLPSSIRYQEQVELFESLYYYARDLANRIEIQFLIRLIEGKIDGKAALLQEGGFLERFLTDESSLSRLVASATPEWCRVHAQRLRELFVRFHPSTSDDMDEDLIDDIEWRCYWKNKNIVDKIEGISQEPPPKHVKQNII
jgi:hypothetical protein